MIARLRPVLLLFLLAALAAPATGGEAAEYWVLGSYSREAGARSEQQLLGAALSAEVLIARFERAGAPLFRVILSTSVQRDVLLAAGIEPWSMDVDAMRIVDAARHRDGQGTGARTTLTPPATEPDLPAALPEAIPEARPSGIAAGEAYADHCETTSGDQRDAACESAAYRDVKAARSRLESSANELRRYCRQAQHAGQPACRTVQSTTVQSTRVQ